jgi:hypothetical protein
MTDESKKSSPVEATPAGAAELKKLIFEYDDIPTELVAVPEWGDIKVLVKGMTGKSRANFLKRASDNDGNISYDRFYAELIIATVYHPDTDEAVFEGADRESINAKSGAALETVATVAQRLSGLGGDDIDAAKKDSAKTENNVST